MGALMRARITNECLQSLLLFRAINGLRSFAGVLKEGFLADFENQEYTKCGGREVYEGKRDSLKHEKESTLI